MIEHNDKSKAICFNCKDVVATTFLYKDVPFSDGSGVVENILAAVCDVCGEVVATPARSTGKIKEAHRSVLQ